MRTLLTNAHCSYSLVRTYRIISPAVILHSHMLRFVRPSSLQLSLQREIAELMPNGELFVISSPHGHDSFLIEIELLNAKLAAWLHR